MVWGTIVDTTPKIRRLVGNPRRRIGAEGGGVKIIARRNMFSFLLLLSCNYSRLLPRCRICHRRGEAKLVDC